MAKVYSIEKVKNLFGKVSLADQYKLEIKVNTEIQRFINNNFNETSREGIKTGPDGIYNGSSDAASFGGLDEKVSVMCRAAQIPGISLEYETLIGARQGVPEIFPTYRKNTAIDCTFYVDKDHDVLRFFYRWLNMINPIVKSTGGVSINAPGVTAGTRGNIGSGISNRSNFYQMKFKDSYVCDISLTKFERDSFGLNNRWNPYNSQNQSTVNGLEYTFYRAFPVDISSIPVSYDTTDVLQVNVTFEYERCSIS